MWFFRFNLVHIDYLDFILRVKVLENSGIGSTTAPPDPLLWSGKLFKFVRWFCAVSHTRSTLTWHCCVLTEFGYLSSHLLGHLWRRKCKLSTDSTHPNLKCVQIIHFIENFYSRDTLFTILKSCLLIFLLKSLIDTSIILITLYLYLSYITNVVVIYLYRKINGI